MTFFIPERRPSDGCHGSSRPSNPLWSRPSSLHRLSRLPSGVMAGWLQVVEEGGKSFSGGGRGGGVICSAVLQINILLGFQTPKTSLAE